MPSLPGLRTVLLGLMTTSLGGAIGASGCQRDCYRWEEISIDPGIQSGYRRFLVGTGGRIFAFTDSTNSDDTIGVEALTSPTTADLLDVFDSENVGAAVGREGTLIVTSDGRNWQPAEIPAPIGDLRGVVLACKTASVGIAVGDAGTILRSSDRAVTWESVASPSSVRLNAVALHEPSNIAVAVGDEGVILRSADAGETWVRIDTPTSQPLLALNLGTCPYPESYSTNTVLAAGPDGTLLRSDDLGEQWTAVAGAPAEDLHAVILDLYPDSIGETHAWLLGEGTVYRWDGAEGFARENAPGRPLTDALAREGTAPQFIGDGILSIRINDCYPD